MKTFEKRLRKLEAKLELELDIRLVWGHFPFPLEGKDNLAPDERVVVDWYRNRAGIISQQERITNDAADRGRTCKRDGYLIDVIEKHHQTCPERERSGSCEECAGTPVAESRASLSSECDPGVANKEG